MECLPVKQRPNRILVPFGLPNLRKWDFLFFVFAYRECYERGLSAAASPDDVLNCRYTKPYGRFQSEFNF